MEIDTCLLKKVEKQEIDCQKFGFYWNSLDQLIEQIHSECAEVQEAHRNNDPLHLQEEIGDLIQAAIGLAVFCKFDPRETLAKSIQKFQKRYDMVVDLANKDGYETLHHQSFEQLMKYWDQAKSALKTTL